MPKGNNSAWLRQQAQQRAEAQRIALELARARAAGGDANDPQTAMAQIQQMLQAIMTLRMRVDRLARWGAEQTLDKVQLRAELKRLFMVKYDFDEYRAAAEEKLGGKLARAMIDGRVQWVVLTAANEPVTSLPALFGEAEAAPPIDLPSCPLCSHLRAGHTSQGCGMATCQCGRAYGEARATDTEPSVEPEIHKEVAVNQPE